MLSSVMKKLLFHSIGALNFPSYSAALGTSSNETKRSAFVFRARASSACVGSKSRPNRQIASTMACKWITTSPPTQLMLWQPSRRSVHAIAASVRGSVSSPLSLSVLMSPFWQKAQRMLQEVKKIVPDPSCPDRRAPPQRDETNC